MMMVYCAFSASTAAAAVGVVQLSSNTCTRGIELKYDILYYYTYTRVYLYNIIIYYDKAVILHGQYVHILLDFRMYCTFCILSRNPFAAILIIVSTFTTIL